MAVTHSRLITGTTRITTATVRGMDRVMAGLSAGTVRTIAVGIARGMAVTGVATTVAIGGITIMAITEVIMAVGTIMAVIMPIVPTIGNPVAATIMADGRR